MSLPLDPQTLPIAATGFPAPIERRWDTLCRNNLGQLVDGNGVVVAIEAGAVTGEATARFKTSLRVGSGVGLAALDGLDGPIVANGVNAGVIFGNRLSPGTNSFGIWYFDGSNFILGTALSTLWTVNPSTGEIVQAAWTAATLGNGWANFGSTIAIAAYRLDLPTNRVNIKGFVGGGAAGTAMFTLPAAMWPTEIRVFTGPVFSGGAWQTTGFPFSVSTAGVVTANAAIAAGGGGGIECSFAI